MNTKIKQLSDDYLRIEQAILYLENHYKDQPSLEDVAANIVAQERSALVTQARFWFILRQ